VDVGTITVQSSHDAPLCPHCVSMKPAWHVLAWSQQPVQLLALQVGATFTHVPPLQVSFEAAQLVHDLPPVPQNESRLPGRQFLLASQQPVGHVFESHVGGGGRQSPPLHVPLLNEQSVQNPPPTPHELFDVPGTHAPV
jgi:hypothetical protein